MNIIHILKFVSMEYIPQFVKLVSLIKYKNMSDIDKQKPLY